MAVPSCSHPEFQVINQLVLGGFSQTMEEERGLFIFLLVLKSSGGGGEAEWSLHFWGNSAGQRRFIYMVMLFFSRDR